MTTPLTVLEGLEEGLSGSSEFSAGSYVLREPDFEGADNRLVQPIVSFQIVDNPRATEWDSDLAGYITDASGARTGRVFEATWEMRLDVFVTIAAGNESYRISSLGHDLQRALLNYDHQQQGEPVPDPDSGGTLDDVEAVVVGNGVPEPDLAGPGLRRWRQELEVTFVSVRETDDPTITTVTVPQTTEFYEDPDTEVQLQWDPSVDTN